MHFKNRVYCCEFLFRVTQPILQLLHGEVKGKIILHCFQCILITVCHDIYTCMIYYETNFRENYEYYYEGGSKSKLHLLSMKQTHIYKKNTFIEKTDFY